MNHILLPSILLVWFALSAPVNAAVRLAPVFGDHMVLQREKPVPIWGQAEPGEKVTVKFAGQTVACETGADGTWKVVLNPLTTSDQPQDLEVSGKNTITMRNVLVGEVWLCAGDFGVFWGVFQSAAGDQEIAAANYPSIRLLKVARKSSNTPLREISGEWMPCSPSTVPVFSGLAYFFGRQLHEELKIPIGLIDASYQYSFVQAWLPAEAFRLIPELSITRQVVESRDPTTPVGKAAFLAAISNIEQWLPVAAKAFQESKPIPPQPRLPAPKPATDVGYSSADELSLIYNGMIHPLIPFSIRGVVWSQGENSHNRPEPYSLFVRGLIESWRKLWGQGDLPVYFELLPQVGSVSDSPPQAIGGWTRLREEQLKNRALPNTVAVVSFDVSDYGLENRNRQDPGKRFARTALANVYNAQTVSSGPVIKQHRIEGDQVVCTFDHVGSGLVVGEMIREATGLQKFQEAKNKPLKHFAVAGADKKWHWADAQINGDTVVLRSANVTAPVAVRYAYADNPATANLYNREGLPALPFRTDDW